jgi:predicted metal-dependent hydrolase
MALSMKRLDQTEQALERGRVLYAAGRFFEAHEAWEEAWREESGATRRLLHGLILVAAAYHKMAVQRQALGMSRLLDKGLAELQPLPDGFAGLRLARFRAALVESREEALAWLAGGPSPSGSAPLGAYVTGGRQPPAPPEGR